MAKQDINPDLTQRDEAPYWAAALALALRSKDRQRVREARTNLRRLGCPIDVRDEAAREGRAAR